MKPITMTPIRRQPGLSVFALLLILMTVALTPSCRTFQAVFQPQQGAIEPATSADILAAFDKDYEDTVNALTIARVAHLISKSDYEHVLELEAQIDKVRVRAKAIVDAGGDPLTLRNVLQEVATAMGELKDKKKNPAAATTRPAV